MGVYPEDDEIRISELIKLRVAEGFLKPHRAKSLEEVASDYLKDLIDRNLIIVSKYGSTGNIRYRKIHDLLRDLCLREIQQEKFLCVAKFHNYNNTSQDMKSQCRTAIPLRVLHALHSSSFTHSFTCEFECDWPNSSLTFKLQRGWNIFRSHHVEFFHLVNSRYLNCSVSSSAFTSSFYLLWNLQTLDISVDSPLLIEIWDMLQLRHLNSNVGITLSDPPCCRVDEIDDFVLENLQTLSRVKNFRCTEEVLKRIPHIIKLKISYPLIEGEKGRFSHYSLNNLGRLHKFQSLYCWFEAFKNFPIQNLMLNLNFPDSLKSLILRDCNFDITTKIGSLPHLEKLRLESCYIGEEWDPVDGQFLSLRYLEIFGNDNLVEWTTDSSNFPCLECLVFTEVYKLKEIPSGIGEIETLQFIVVLSSPQQSKY